MRKKPVTIYDIARMANASVSTVSRVLSNSNYPVSHELKAKIKAVAKELNYVPNMIGRQLKTNNSMTIGVIVPSISNPFYADMVMGIEEIARENGYHVFLCNTRQNPDLEAEYFQTLLEKQVKGLIVSSISKQKDVLGFYLEKGLNVVAIDQAMDHPEVYQIGFDYKKGAYLACKHLAEKGHRKIAFITAALDRPSRIGMFHGYTQFLLESGIEPSEAWMKVSKEPEEQTYSNTFEFQNGRRLARELIGQDDLPTAVLACNDLTAVGVISEFNENGIVVPRDISVIGFDNIELSQMITPALTTVHIPKYEMGKAACSTLIRLIRGEKTDRKEWIMQPKLVERQSVAETG